MPLIEGFRVQNYRALKDVTLGRLWNQQHQTSLTPLVVVIGKNGVGKSTLFDAFGFLSDCLAVGVEEACDLRGRGGFLKIVSAGARGPIQLEIYYRESSNHRPITYELSIALDGWDRPYVQKERLRQRRKGASRGRPYSFLSLENGQGTAWAGEETFEGEEAGRVPVELTDNRRLGIATLGALKEHPRITRFRNFLQGWHLSYLTPDAARSLPLAGPQKHLNVHGDNLGNVVQYMEREHGQRFRIILEKIATKIPGIERIDTKPTDDGRLLLRFNDRAFEDPFFSQQMSDGTLKLFAYMLLLEDPDPAPFIGIEEPENGLYHKLMPTLVEEFKSSLGGRRQIFVTTHQPYLVDALRPEETWILSKGRDGFSTIRRAADDEVIQQLWNEEIPLGGLWFSDYLDAQ